MFEFFRAIISPPAPAPSETLSVEVSEDDINSSATEAEKFTTPQKEPKETLSGLPSLDNSQFDPSRCTITAVPKDITHSWSSKREPLAIVIDNLLTPEECKSWIEYTEQVGYEVALVNIGGGLQIKRLDYRNSSRCLIDDSNRAKELFERIKPFMELKKEIENKVPYELNERLRFLRYDPGEYFAPHLDGRYDRPKDHPRKGDYSIVTFQLYLSDGFEGGTTRFFHSSDQNRYHDVVPKAGSVLLFEHRLEHSGEVVVSGRKYAVRTDIMFANPASFSTEEELKSFL